MIQEAAGANRPLNSSPGGGVAASGLSPYTHDVFISYSHEDVDWVRDDLVPFLEREQLRVFIDYREFLAGEFIRECIERAVRSSRHTVVVLTPEWLTSDWARYEELLASADDPLRRKRKVIPILLRPCTPTGGLALLLHVDFTDPSRRPERMQNLLQSLRTDRSAPLPPPVPDAPSEPPTVRGESVRSGLVALCELMQKPQVRAAVIAFRIHFEEACQQIEILGNYKDQHDLLHRLQNECYDHTRLELSRFPADKRSRRIVEDGKLTLQEVLGELRGLAARRHEPPEAWIESHLASAYDCLDAALARSKKEQLRLSLRSLDRVLSQQPSRINTLLIGAAKALRLPHLVQALTTVCEALSAPGLDPEHVQRFERGVATLAELNRNLFGLIRAHDQWQEVDLELRRIESNLLAQNLKELEYSWPALSPKLESLCKDIDEAWAVELEACRKRLSSALKKNAEGMPELFYQCRRRANFHFYQVDTALKEQCDELRKAAEPLAAVLRMLA